MIMCDRIVITPRAGGDLEGIYDRIAEDSPQNARLMIARILDALEPLKLFPHRTILSRQSAKLQYPVRSLPISTYIIYFRVIDEERIVRVLCVRHGARRRPRRFE